MARIFPNSPKMKSLTRLAEESFPEDEYNGDTELERAVRALNSSLGKSQTPGSPSSYFWAHKGNGEVSYYIRRGNRMIMSSPTLEGLLEKVKTVHREIAQSQLPPAQGRGLAFSAKH